MSTFGILVGGGPAPGINGVSFDALGIDHLITIRGDDTVSSAMRVATIGFETAREHATAVVERILEDTRTTRRWFFIIMMGRTAGHLPLGAGKAADAPVPFADITDSATGRASVRQVDTSTDSYLNTLALQERINARDLSDEATLARIAEAAKLSPEEAKKRYAPL